MDLQWRKVEVTGPFDELNRPYGFSTANLVGHRIYMYGGTTTMRRCKAVFVYDILARRWEEMKPEVGESFFVRTMHSSVLVGEKLLVFGGLDQSGYRSELLELDLVMRTCNVVMCRGLKMKYCAGHSSCYLPKKDCLLVYTGRFGKKNESLFSFHVSSRVWRQVEAKGEEPTRRWKQGSALVDGHWFLYGGDPVDAMTQASNTLYVLDTDPKVPCWSKVPTFAYWPQTVGPIAVINGQLILYKSDDAESKWLCAYDPKACFFSGFRQAGDMSTGRKSNVIRGSFPNARVAGMMVCNEKQIFVFGGHRDILRNMYVLENTETTL